MNELQILRTRVGEMAAEIERLQSVIDEANAQGPELFAAYGDSNGSVVLELFGFDEKECKNKILNLARSEGYKGTLSGYLMRKSWEVRPLYARPIPAQQSAHGLTFEDYEEALAVNRELVRELDVLLNGDGAAKGASLCDIVAQVARIVREKGAHLLQQSPAVAVPDEIPRDDYADSESKAHRRGWNDCREEMLRNIAKPSPRITEQDARTIVQYFEDYANEGETAYSNFHWEQFLALTGRALLNKLNDKPESVGV